LEKSEQYRALLRHEGWALVKSASREALLRAWQNLLVCKPEEVRYLQGLIDGMNTVLECANAHVQSADEILAQIRADQATVAQETLARASIQRERQHRTIRMGAELS
jgi:hypothetical protein